jgi:O-antigen/teichoic acid export membrane protein
LVSIAGLALVPALPWLVAGTSELAGESREAFLIALIVAVPLAPFLLMRSVLDADQKGYLLNAVIAVQSLTVTGVAVWLAISGQGLPGQALAAAAGMAVQAGLFAVLAYRGYSWARPGWPAWAESAALLRRTSSLLILAILGGIAARAEFPLVNVLYGPEETARYALGQRLFLIYAGLVAVIGNSIWAPAADLFHRGELQRMAVHLERALRGALVAGAAGAVAIAAVTPQFLRLWVGEGYDPGRIARTGFAVVFPLLGLNILLTWVLTATGQTRAMLASTTLYCLVTVGAGAGLGSMYGPGGVAWGMALGVGSAVAINLMVASTVFRLDAVGVSLRLGLTAAIGALFGFAVSQVVSLLPGMGWLELIVVLAAGWLGFLALGWFVILTRDDRRELRSRLRRR